MKINGVKELACPNCGYKNLHHGQVSVYSRSEDQPTTRTIVQPITGTAEITEGVLGGNPSARRDGLVIDFDCEHCSALPQLCISQHKGTTHIEWRNTEAR